MATFLLLPILLAQTLPALEVKNLGATYRYGARRGLLTLEEGHLVLSEARANGRSRTLAFDFRRGARTLAQSTLSPTVEGHRRRGTLVVTPGSESLMGDLNGDGDALDTCAIAADLASGATLAPHAIVPPDPGAPWNPVLARDVVGLVLSEAAEGVDLNGDGNLNDYVPCAWRPSTGQFAATQRPSLHVDAFDGALGLLVDEQQQDWTGDGDRSDTVFFVYELATGTVVNTHLAVASGNWNVSGQSSGGRTAVFAASEAGTGRDLDGDGLLTRDVLHAYSLDRGTLDNLLATGPTFPHVVSGHWVAYVRREVDAGDLNGDGDALDTVLHVYAGATGAIQNLALASGGASSLPGSSLGFAVYEASQGVDLNADGDLSDDVVHVLDLATGTVLNVGLAGSLSHEGWGYAPETSNGRDLNGDGDLDDSVPHLLADGPFPAVTLGIAASSVRLSTGRAGMLVSEHYERRDLDGDGDQEDYVLHAYKRASGVLTNLGLVPSGPVFQMAGRFALVPLGENGMRDWNGDGDANDDVLHLLDLERRTLVDLALAVRTTEPLWMDTELWAVVVDETDQGADLNENGVIANEGVVHVIDPRRVLTR